MAITARSCINHLECMKIQNNIAMATNEFFLSSFSLLESDVGEVSLTSNNSGFEACTDSDTYSELNNISAAAIQPCQYQPLRQRHVAGTGRDEEEDDSSIHDLAHFLG